jgi:hypothetical protein
MNHQVLHWVAGLFLLFQAMVSAGLAFDAIRRRSSDVVVALIVMVIQGALAVALLVTV